LILDFFSFKIKLMIKENNGFTLIEVLVAIASFIVIISIVVGGFAGALRSQRQAITLLNANYNSSLVLEQMAREIRTGMNFSINPLAFPAGSELSFLNANGQSVVYRLNTNNLGIEKSVDGGLPKKITADDVVVDYLTFILSGENPQDGKQPRITILVGIRSRESGVSGSVVNLQTTISPRFLDG
jgi:type II secretory pathway pseudopilin PulG